jgi:hypothetical protein
MHKLKFDFIDRAQMYTIFLEDDKECGSIGSMLRLTEAHQFNWHLTIPMASIDLTGKYRNDLMEHAQLLWDKHCGNRVK